MKWQPIETAPKDGTEILAWHLDGKTWHQVIWQKGRDSFGMRWNPEYCQGRYAFSHWMPLPEPPEAITSTAANGRGAVMARFEFIKGSSDGTF